VISGRKGERVEQRGSIEYMGIVSSPICVFYSVHQLVRKVSDVVGVV
jgi:hypothetical protein